MFGTEVEHFLDLKHVARTGVGASFNDQLDKLRVFLVLNEFAYLHRGLCSSLLTQKEKA